jgi:hypothetical protein
LNYITNHCALHAVLDLRNQFVTVMPALEWTSHLNVSKVVVPFKLRDARNPASAKRQIRQQGEGSHDFRGSPGQHDSRT